MQSYGLLNLHHSLRQVLNAHSLLQSSLQPARYISTVIILLQMRKLQREVSGLSPVTELRFEPSL